ncbi:Uncharacterised protein g8814 [Pycnogonum litorale]
MRRSSLTSVSVTFISIYLLLSTCLTHFEYVTEAQPISCLRVCKIPALRKACDRCRTRVPPRFGKRFEDYNKQVPVLESSFKQYWKDLIDNSGSEDFYKWRSSTNDYP